MNSQDQPTSTGLNVPLLPLLLGTLFVGIALGAGVYLGMRGGGLPSLGNADGFLPGSSVAAECSVDGPVLAIVAGRAVTDADIDVEVAVQEVLQQQTGRVMDPEGLPSFRRELLDQVVDQLVIEQGAGSVAMETTAVLTELTGLIGQYGLDASQLRESVLAKGVPADRFDAWASRQVQNGRYMQSSAAGLPPSELAASLADQVDIRFCLNGEEQAPAKVGELAPDFELPTINDQTLRLSDLRGKAVMINFWATWCGPCKIEMPLFVNTYESHKDDLVVLGVDVDEEASLVKAFVANNRLTFPILLDDAGEVAMVYRVRALPTTYFVSPDGRIAEMHRGAILNRPQLQPLLQKILPGVQGFDLGLLDRLN